MVLLIDRKRSIGDASKEVGVQEYVIRYWITQFGDYVKPTIGNGNRRYFYDKDIKILKFIKYNLHDKGLTIKGLQNLFETENLENIKEFDNKINIDESNNKIESKNSKNNAIITNNSYTKAPENSKIIKDTTSYNNYKKDNLSENTNNSIYKNNEFIKKNNSIILYIY